VHEHGGRPPGRTLNDLDPSIVRSAMAERALHALGRRTSELEVDPQEPCDAAHFGLLG
jgi:hypothetical protein